jgi:hypothetical protein
MKIAPREDDCANAYQRLSRTQTMEQSPIKPPDGMKASTKSSSSPIARKSDGQNSMLIRPFLLLAADFLRQFVASGAGPPVPRFAHR